ncbi:hypothetical protein FJT64_001819 [Amphibalanus amphitrite]|uniref:Uncharacterized protein n=1 Tax=Amphibalanus amphitrite TaxID=1232801 RepID=A0A6A4X7G8_AMPAM|nr:hypothetical protein FJT64_001819 [Amphibalanus amphitrite]
MTTLDLLETNKTNVNMMRIYFSETSGQFDKNHTFPGTSDLGRWRPRYYLTLAELGDELIPKRCLTFEPSEYLKESAKNDVKLELMLKVPELFGGHALGYRLFVHDTEEPNVGDLAADELGADIEHEQTVSVDLPKLTDLSLHLTARMLSRVNVRRRPCREEPGYSAIQCLKECLWSRLAANISCRLPHMVGAGVYLPDMSGPLDHLPPCARPVQMESSKNRRIIRFCENIDEKCAYTDDHTWYTPTKIPPPEEYEYDSPSYYYKPRHSRAAQPSSIKTRPQLSENKQMNLLDLPFYGEKCIAPEDLETFVDDSLVTDTQGCDCLPACHQTFYQLSDWSSRERYASSCKVKLTLSISLKADEISESISFTLPTLLANIGGTIGIVTGFSLFTLAAAGETLAWKFDRK